LQLVRNLLIHKYPEQSGKFFPLWVPSHTEKTMLNAIDFASSSPPTSTEAASGTPSDANAAPTGFGKLMNQAFAQLANGKLAGTAETSGGESAEGQDLAKTSALDTVGLETDAPMAWMPGWPGAITVQQVSVGPNLQAITPSSPAPDDSSLAAFAKAQGLDSQAIAWLLAGQVSTGSVNGSTGLATLTDAALAPGATSLPQPMTANTLTGLSAGAGAGAGVGLAPGNGTGIATMTDMIDTPHVLAGSALLSGLASDPMGGKGVAITLSHMAGDDGQAPDAASALSSLRWAQLGGAAANPSAVGTPVTPGATAAASNNLTTQTDPGMAVAAAAVGASAVIAARTPGNWQLGTARATSWHESELQLGALNMAEEAPAEPDLGAMTGLAASAMALLPEAMDPVAAPRESTAAAPTTSLTSASTPAQATSSAAETYEQMEQLSQKMADAIGERLMREIDRGHWNVKLMLKPAHLGHIEVEMRLHAGALDASFTASQSQTRDILQDGLNRLKETLNQMGMDVANLDVRNGQNRQNGGNPTPGSARLTAPEASSQEAETPAPVTGSTPRPRTADGWDVMV
jgi:hypothetical protein